jgi:phage terminase large subunit-like protein
MHKPDVINHIKTLKKQQLHTQQNSTNKQLWSQHFQTKHLN